MTVYLCFFVLWLFSCVIIVEGGPKKAKTKSGAELRGIKQYCSKDEECESKQCCPIPGRENVKKCFENCAQLRLLNQVTEKKCVTDTFNNKNFTYCVTPTVTWYQALRDCCREGGELPLVNDGSTLIFLSKMTKDLQTTSPSPFPYELGWMWTGLTKITTPNTSTEPWVWYQPNSPKWNASFWDNRNGSPNNNIQGAQTSQSCATIGPYEYYESRFGLTDDSCFDRWGYACVTPL